MDHAQFIQHWTHDVLGVRRMDLDEAGMPSQLHSISVACLTMVQ